MNVDSQKCDNGHPCDNEGYCRVATCVYSRQKRKGFK